MFSNLSLALFLYCERLAERLWYLFTLTILSYPESNYSTRILLDGNLTVGTCAYQIKMSLVILDVIQQLLTGCAISSFSFMVIG